MAQCPSLVLREESFSNLKGLVNQRTANLDNIDDYIDINILSAEVKNRRLQQDQASPMGKIENILQELLLVLETNSESMKTCHADTPMILESSTDLPRADDTLITLEQESIELQSEIHQHDCVFVEEANISYQCSAEPEYVDLIKESAPEKPICVDHATQTQFMSISQQAGKDKTVKECDLSLICEDIGDCWKRLGANLNINSSKVDNIDADESKVEEKAYQMLLTWKRQEGTKATLKKLKKGLKKTKRNDIADKLTEMENNNCIPVSDVLDDSNPLSGLKIDLSFTTEEGEENEIHICEDSFGSDEYVVVKLSQHSSDNWTSKLKEARDNLDAMLKQAEEQANITLERQRSLKIVQSKVIELKKEIEERKQEAESKSLRVEVVEEQEKSIELIFKNHLRLLALSEQGKNLDILQHVVGLQKDLRKLENDLFVQCKKLREESREENAVQRICELQKRQTVRLSQTEGIARFISGLFHEHNQTHRQTLGNMRKGNQGMRTIRSMTESKIASRRQYLNDPKMRNRSKSNPVSIGGKKKSQPLISSPILLIKKDIQHTEKQDGKSDRLI